MKISKNVLYIFLALIVVAALYRIVPGRPYGFAPQIAMALFGGALIKDRKMAFALPVLSMFLSDALFELLYYTGISPMWGFYEGQLTNYLLFALLTVIGFFIKKINVINIAAASFAAPTVYFLISNFMVWLSGTGGFQRPKTWDGLMMSFADGLPFYKNSVAGTLFFAGLFFGGYYLIRQYMLKPKLAQ
ncbi:DUF6580 family putative transport protein [Agriterribacter sp.]|uniref:DUF6580 family putative transport protein n=1 Tax=Agriterribacter sp. TaxID=2821509 RepID=UPI002CC88F33|nr:DUF6580 family putative transport protein [Agriterribacter sp.]HTN06382.1 DUF6580 family putative transport protein [Agriterribacter sp.]